MGIGEVARFETVPWAARIGALVFMVPWVILLGTGHDMGIPMMPLLGAVLALARNQVVFDPAGRWVQRQIGIVVPLVRLGRKSVTRVVLQERLTEHVTGRESSARRRYHVMLCGETTASISVARERDLLEARRQAEELARAAHLPILDLATGAGLRPAGTLDASLRSRVRQMGWHGQPLGPSGRLRPRERPGAISVELPELSLVKRLLLPLGIPTALLALFGALTVIAALGLNKSGHDPAITGGTTLICWVVLVVCLVAYRDRFVRVREIEVGPAGLVIRATRLGRDVSRRFAVDEIESIGIGGHARLSDKAFDVAQTVVIASDQQVVSVGVGLTSAEQGWLAGFLTQAVATYEPRS